MGLSGTAEQSGMTKRVRFSYKANKRNIFEGAGPLTEDLDVADA